MTIGPIGPIGLTPASPGGPPLRGGGENPPADCADAIGLMSRMLDREKQREAYRHAEFLKWLDSDDGERGLMLAMITHDKMRDAVLAVLSNYSSCTDHNGDAVDSSDVLIAITDAMDDVFEDHTGRTYLPEWSRDATVKAVKVRP